MKHIVVTGGAKGIGKAIVEELAALDYKITATYNQSKDSADAISKKYPNVTFVQADLEDRNALRSLIKRLSKEPIDVLINNAGVYVGKAFDKYAAEELYSQMDLLFAAPTQLIHGLLPALKKGESPLIINISSQARDARLTGEAVYSAVKSAISTLSYVLRAELNPKGIRVTAVEPFGVNTYGIPEPSNLILPKYLASLVRFAIEQPPHIQIDTLTVSHIKQTRPDYPDWIEK